MASKEETAAIDVDLEGLVWGEESSSEKLREMVCPSLEVEEAVTCGAADVRSGFCDR